MRKLIPRKCKKLLHVKTSQDSVFKVIESSRTIEKDKDR